MDQNTKWTILADSKYIYFRPFYKKNNILGWAILYKKGQSQGKISANIFVPLGHHHIYIKEQSHGKGSFCS